MLELQDGCTLPMVLVAGSGTRFFQSIMQAGVWRQHCICTMQAGVKRKIYAMLHFWFFSSFECLQGTAHASFQT